jgi:hypothetical protein
MHWKVGYISLFADSYRLDNNENESIEIPQHSPSSANEASPVSSQERQEIEPLNASSPQNLQPAPMQIESQFRELSPPLLLQKTPSQSSPSTQEQLPIEPEEIARPKPPKIAKSQPIQPPPPIQIQESQPQSQTLPQPTEQPAIQQLEQSQPKQLRAQLQSKPTSSGQLHPIQKSGLERQIIPQMRINPHGTFARLLSFTNNVVHLPPVKVLPQPNEMLQFHSFQLPTWVNTTVVVNSRPYIKLARIGQGGSSIVYKV